MLPRKWIDGMAKQFSMIGWQHIIVYFRWRSVRKSFTAQYGAERTRIYGDEYIAVRWIHRKTLASGLRISAGLLSAVCGDSLICRRGAAHPLRSTWTDNQKIHNQAEVEVTREGLRRCARAAGLDQAARRATPASLATQPLLARYAPIGTRLYKQSIVHESVPALVGELNSQFWIANKGISLSFRDFVVFFVVD